MSFRIKLKEGLPSASTAAQPLILEEYNFLFFSLWQIPNLHFKIPNI